jgi:hypothetical protein
MGSKSSKTRPEEATHYGWHQDQGGTLDTPEKKREFDRNWFDQEERKLRAKLSEIEKKLAEIAKKRTELDAEEAAEKQLPIITPE